MTAAICLGSNLGDRQKNLTDATEVLMTKGYEIINQSSIYETAPVGYLSDNDFLNQVILIKTDKGPEALLQDMLNTETQLGRRRNLDETSDRTIDLDLLFYENLVMQGPGIILPHPRLHLRRFVLKPLADVADSWVHPILNQSIGLLLKNCADQHHLVKI
jgi:2-amino-4-hydroxy-6-hydroxymethyldihydropteridine diphosphokinase